MPVTKLSSGRSSAVMLRYLTRENEEGTRVRALGGNVSGDDWRSAEREFKLTREQFGVRDGIRYHHASLSMDPKDLGTLAAPDGSPNYRGMVAFGEQWAERNGISERHQVLVVAHGDKAHPHVHLCWSSVSREDGGKWHSDRAFLERARDTTDGLAREYGIRNEPSREKNPNRPPDRVLRAAARGADPYSWKVDLKARVSEAARASIHEEDFKKKLGQRGIEVRRRGEAYTYSFRDPDNKLRVARASRLGEEYQRGPLLERFEAQRREVLRGPRGAEEFATRLRREKGSPLRSWRSDFRHHLSEARGTATNMDDYRDRLAERGIVVEQSSSGHRYTFTSNDGQAHRIEGRSLGPAYSEERLSSRFTSNSHTPPITAGVPVLSRAVTGAGGIAERLTHEINRESNAGHADVPDPRPRPHHGQRRDERDGHEHF